MEVVVHVSNTGIKKVGNLLGRLTTLGSPQKERIGYKKKSKRRKATGGKRGEFFTSRQAS